MNNLPNLDKDTVRIPIGATYGGAAVGVLNAVNGLVQLRISLSDDWHAVTQIAADTIHNIWMLFCNVQGELMTSVESPNMLQAIYNPIANELNSLSAELHKLFVQNLGMEPHHYQWSLSFLGLRSAPRLRNPQATGGLLNTIMHPDIEMGDAAPTDTPAVPQPSVTTSAAAPPPCVHTPAPNLGGEGHGWQV
ncbi:hypothetical protein VTO73DRAFT_8666 [Trametes versicolor]